MSGEAGSGTPEPQDLDALLDFSQTLASPRGAREQGGPTPPRAGLESYTGPGPYTGAKASRADVLRSHGLAVGLTVPSIQLAHALELLNRCQRRPVSRSLDRREAPDSWPIRTLDRELQENADFDEDAEEARRLVADALASLAGTAGLSVPLGTLTQGPAPTAVDPEVEAVFVEFDMAREAWVALPPSVETWQPHPDVDRYIAAEDAILNLTDGSADVLSRQAGLLLELADEIADQTGPAAANAIANVAQGLLLRLRR